MLHSSCWGTNKIELSCMTSSYLVVFHVGCHPVMAVPYLPSSYRVCIDSRLVSAQTYLFFFLSQRLKCMGLSIIPSQHSGGCFGCNSTNTLVVVAVTHVCQPQSLLVNHLKNLGMYGD